MLYLLIEYDEIHPVKIENLDILKTQRKGNDRYMGCSKNSALESE